MNRKQMCRRTLAGIMAVLTVAGNLLAPSQMQISRVAETAMTAEAATIDSSNRFDYSGIEWDGNGVLTITKGITNAEGAVGYDHPDQITGSVYASFFDNISYTDVKKIVIASGTSMPKSWYHLFENFTELEEFVVESEVDASNVYDFGYAFAGLTKLKTVDLSGLTNTTLIDYIENMFSGCTSIEYVNLGMLGGENAGLRRWEIKNGHGAVYPAIDHVRRVVAGCNNLQMLDLSGEYLYNLWVNVNSKQSGKSIDYILNELMADNNSPKKSDIIEELARRFWEYYEMMQDLHQWKPYNWTWEKVDGVWTCTVDVQKLKEGATNTHPENWIKETGKPCEITTTVDPEPTCTKKGMIKYVAQWVNTEVTPNARFTNTETMSDEIEMVPHKFETLEDDDDCGFIWSDDYSHATLVEKCSRCLTETRRTTVETTSVYHPATCSSDAYTEYFAVCNDKTDQKTVYHEGTKLEHEFNVFKGFVWGADYTTAQVELGCANCEETTLVDLDVAVFVKEPTCTQDGYTSYSIVYGDETDTKIVPGAAAKEHEFNVFKGFVWGADYTTAQVELGCANCEETTLVDLEVAVFVKEPTCTEAGYTSYTIVYGDETDTKIVPGEPAHDHIYGEPTWTWSEDHSTASATFTCTACQDNNQTVEANVSVEETAATAIIPGSRVYTAVCELNGTTYDDTYEEEIPAYGDIAYAKQVKVVFGGKIGLLFEMELTDEILEDAGAYVTYEQNGVITTQNIADLAKDGNICNFKFNVVAKKYADDVTFRMYSGDGTPIQMISKTSGKNYSVNGIQYSVKKYADYMAQNGSTEQMKAIADALGIYCQAAQIYFDYNAEGLSITDKVANVDADKLNDYAPVVTGSNPDDISVKQLSAVFVSSNDLKVTYFLNDDADINSLSFKIDNRAVKAVYTTAVDSNGETRNVAVLTVSSILPEDFDVAHSFTISDGESTTVVSASILSYAQLLITKPNQTQEAKDLAKAMLLYFETAEAYDALLNT